VTWKDFCFLKWRNTAACNILGICTTLDHHTLLQSLQNVSGITQLQYEAADLALHISAHPSESHHPQIIPEIFMSWRLNSALGKEWYRRSEAGDWKTR